MNELVIKLLLISGELRDQLGREPTPAELAERLDLTPEEVEKLLDKAENPDSPVVPLDAATQANLPESTERVLASLSPREERVLRMRFGIGKDAGPTIEDVSKQFEIICKRIRRIEAKAFKKLKTQKKLRESPAPNKVPTRDFVKPDMVPRPCDGPANDNDGR